MVVILLWRDKFNKTFTATDYGVWHDKTSATIFAFGVNTVMRAPRATAIRRRTELLAVILYIQILYYILLYYI